MKKKLIVPDKDYKAGDSGKLRKTTKKRSVAEIAPNSYDVINLKQESIENEKTKSSKKHGGTLADKPVAGRKEKTVSGKHSGSGTRVYGVRRRAGKSQHAEKVSEESEQYTSTTRFIESSIGVKSYAELAPYLAKSVERVLASILIKDASDLKISPEFFLNLHKDAFGELFPSWAGHYRDRDVTVSKHIPPSHYEVPVMMRQYCDDLEFRLLSLGSKPPLTDALLEALAFAEGRFLSIHPFLDFNGRVTRMLLFTLCYRLDLPPVELVSDENNKANYLIALSEADKFNWQPLVEVWRWRLGLKNND